MVVPASFVSLPRVGRGALRPTARGGVIPTPRGVSGLMMKGSPRERTRSGDRPAERQAHDPTNGTVASAVRVVYIVNVTQNISEALTNERPIDRAAVEEELLVEMAGFGVRDSRAFFKSWHRGALSLVHLNVLTVLLTEGPMPMSRLAEALDVSVASATGIVSRMERRGVVERRHGLEDRRIVLVHLTDAGRKVFDDIEAHRRLALSRVIALLSDLEVESMLVGVRAMRLARERIARGDCDDAPGGAPPDGRSRDGLPAIASHHLVRASGAVD